MPWWPPDVSSRGGLAPVSPPSPVGGKKWNLLFVFANMQRNIIPQEIFDGLWDATIINRNLFSGTSKKLGMYPEFTNQSYFLCILILPAWETPFFQHKYIFLPSQQLQWNYQIKKNLVFRVVNSVNKQKDRQYQNGSTYNTNQKAWRYWMNVLSAVLLNEPRALILPPRKSRRVISLLNVGSRKLSTGY